MESATTAFCADAPRQAAAGSRPLSVVIISHFFPAHGGGIELVAGRLADRFATLGLRVHWFASAGDPPPPSRTSGITCMPVASCNLIERLTQLPYPLWSPGAIPSLWKAIGGSDVVHIHEHLYWGSLLGLAIARLRRRPVIVTQHIGALRLRHPAPTLLFTLVTRLLGRLVFRAAARSVFISDNVRRFFGRERDPNARMIFNGVDTTLFQPPSGQQRRAARSALGLRPDQPVVLFVGRFVRKKGLGIIEQLASRFPDAQWLLIGSGPEQPAGWKQPNVRIVGRVEHAGLRTYYQAADLLLLPASGEGLPLVVQEALSCGLGVLSTNEVASACPAAAMLIRHCAARGHEDGISDWCAALAHALADSRYLQDRTARARQSHALWSWDRCAGEYLQLFAEVTHAPAVSSRSSVSAAVDQH